jgi:hypothetical protein
MEEDFFSSYLPYTSNTETPAWFNRWSAITGIGAFLGRQYYFEHGHFEIHPNLYTMLIGTPGTRKSTSIKVMKKLLLDAGYNSVAASKTTKEKFLMDLAGEVGEGEVKSAEDFLDQNLFGDTNDAAEMFVMADEFTTVIGNGNIEFISILGELWDFNGTYTNRIKNGKSISIHNPTISILGGNTPTNLALAFPPEVIGQGFFSRLLLIYGESNGKKIAFPRPPDPAHTLELIGRLKRIKSEAYGIAELHPTAEKLLEKIYNTHTPVDDVRFESYATRRFSHLLKICLCVSAARLSKSITEQDVVHANTILCHAEHFMPKALGEFGKSKHSDVSHKIVQFLEANHGIVEFKQIWKQVANDLEKQSDLATLLQNLLTADKIQTVKGGLGFLPKRKIIDQSDSSMVDYSYLTEEEKGMSK